MDLSDWHEWEMLLITHIAVECGLLSERDHLSIKTLLETRGWISGEGYRVLRWRFGLKEVYWCPVEDEPIRISWILNDYFYVVSMSYVFTCIGLLVH